MLGPVFRAHDPDTDRLVAIKLFQLDFTPEQSRSLADRLEQLADHWPDHPSLVAALAGGLEGHAPYLVSEYVASDSLDARLRRRVAGGFRQLLHVLEQVAAGLDAAAEAGLAHGSLHPRDILVATTGETRVTGVGVAQVIEAAGGRAPLRRPYAAPEQTGRLGWDHRADIYALGVLATELLVGRRPSGGAVASSVSDLLVQGEGLDPEACRRALAQALAESPSARPPRASDLVDALKAAVTEPDEDEQEPLDLPLRVAPPADGAQRGEGPDLARETPDEELAAVLASDDAESMVQEQAFAALDEQPAETDPLDVEFARTASVEPEHVWPEATEPDLREPEVRDPAFREPAPVVLAPTVPSPAELAEPEDDEAVYGAATRVSARRHDESGVSPVGREFLDPDPRPPARSPGLLVALLGIGLVLGLAGGYLLWGRNAARTDHTASTTTTATSGQPSASTGSTSEPRPVTEEPLSPPAAAGAGQSSAPPASTPSAGTRAQPAARPTTGRLVVRSTPPGARVIIDGRARGTTPLTLVDLPLATYGVRILREGFEERSERVALTRTRPAATVDIALPRVAPAAKPGAKPPASGVPAAVAPATPPAPVTAPAGTARLEVVSRPSGARVTLDGRAAGTTPLTMPAVTVGAHTIRIELDGYRTWTTTVQVRAGAASRVSASLETGERR